MAPLFSILALALAVIGAATAKKPKYFTTISDLGEDLRPFTCVKTVMPTFGPMHQTRTYGHRTTTVTPTCEPYETVTKQMGHGPVIQWVKTVTIDMVTETGPCLRTDTWLANQTYEPTKSVLVARPTSA